MENGVQLYCITHKEYPNLPDTSLVHPLLVGMADVPNIYLKTRDFVPGLSKMNGNWNELEGLYYIRYNCDAEIKGQYQYSRRIPLTSTQIIELLSNHVFISGYSRLEPYTIQTQYCISHHIEDLVLCGEIIKSMYPELYDAGWNLSMNSNIMLAGNCFIARAKDYDAYIEFLFSVLNRFNFMRGFQLMDDIYKYYSAFPYNYVDVKYQSRVSGFLAERLFTFYNIAKFGGFDQTALIGLDVLPK